MKCRHIRVQRNEKLILQKDERIEKPWSNSQEKEDLIRENYWQNGECTQ